MLVVGDVKQFFGTNMLVAEHDHNLSCGEFLDMADFSPQALPVVQVTNIRYAQTNIVYASSIILTFLMFDLNTVQFKCGKPHLDIVQNLRRAHNKKWEISYRLALTKV